MQKRSIKRKLNEMVSRHVDRLWPPYVRGQAIIFLSCGFFYLSVCLSVYLSILLLLFSSPNLSGRTLDVYHTSTHGVALVRI